MSSSAATTTTTPTTTATTPTTTMPTDGGIVDKIFEVGTIDEQVVNLTTALQREKVAKRKVSR